MLVGMIRSMLFLALVALCGCDTPSRHFAGLPATRVTVDGSVFDVRIRGNKAEAIRTNAQYAPRPGPILRRASIAMRQASGCDVGNLLGDQAVAVATLSCSGAKNGAGGFGPLPSSGSFTCTEIPSSVIAPDGLPYSDFECDEV